MRPLNKKQNLIRKSVHSFDEVIPFVMFEKKTKETRMELDGDLVNMASDRLKLFARKSHICCVCELEGTFFAKERGCNDVSFHLNLYGIDGVGDEVLLTKDHIVPSSKGGRDFIENYQTMCAVCNSQKGRVEAGDKEVEIALINAIAGWQEVIEGGHEMADLMKAEERIELAKQLLNLTRETAVL
jgi:hypothetical protein